MQTKVFGEKVEGVDFAVQPNREAMVVAQSQRSGVWIVISRGGSEGSGQRN